MTVDEASRAAEVSLVKSYEPLNEEYCSYFKPQGEPKGISLMVAKGRIVRIDISNKQVTTIKGAKIGDTEEQILSLFSGQIRVIKNPLGGPGKDLTFVPRYAKDSNFCIILETGNDNRVKSFRAGQLIQVEYIKSCF